MKRINMMMPVRMLKALRAVSAASGLSVSEIIRRAVDAYLEGEA